jgi:hypothetical protein
LTPKYYATLIEENFIVKKKKRIIHKSEEQNILLKIKK